MWTTCVTTGAAIAVSALAIAGCSTNATDDARPARSASPSAAAILSATDRNDDSSPGREPTLRKPTRSSSRQPVRACAAAQINVSPGPALSPETGEHGVTYKIHNVSRQTCALAGYPAVSLLDGAKPLPFSYVHKGQYVTSAAPHVVTLAGRTDAYFLVAKYRCDARTQATSTGTQVRLPGQTLAFQVTTAPRVAIGFCTGNGNPDPGNRVQISPIEAEIPDLTDA